jgi:hypothetical protein
MEVTNFLQNAAKLQASPGWGTTSQLPLFFRMFIAHIGFESVQEINCNYFFHFPVRKATEILLNTIYYQSLVEHALKR